jgi:hypothetical protein
MPAAYSVSSGLMRIYKIHHRDALQQGRLLEATVLAALALLVTQGQQARDDGDALELFTRHFLAGGLLPPSFVAMIGMAHAAVQTRPQGVSIRRA